MTLKWDSESVCIHEQPATAGYTNVRGAIVIRQSAWPDDEDTYVHVAPQYVARLLRAIAAEAGIAITIGAPASSPAPSPSEPTSNAERQRRYRQRHTVTETRNDRNGESVTRNGHDVTHGDADVTQRDDDDASQLTLIGGDSK